MGGVVGLLVVAATAWVVVGADSDSGFPEAEYRLTLPETLLDGGYELTRDFSDSSGSGLKEEAESGWGARDVRAAVATYAPADRGGQLNVSGVYGRFTDSDEARDTMMKGAAGTDGLTLAVPPKDFEPAGADTTVTCQVITMDNGGAEVFAPMCGWNDGNTAAIIGEITPGNAADSPEDLDLAAFAERTLRIRSELRKPIG
ncbi:hypothetical protein JIX56_13980 [Streptomyces sp. CA-210063]|uniref:hypothetical protein n=1 Tax=Streptomyces sp. CA-210063 TaxID=2801029 RepID=UPI00214CD463|nr:hypothetical protein [Streptomyces sp. CA-210063]UUU30928.1 hypothetical protein JIX56_13980 [Streptomyces sp. CA-210063]